MGLGGVAIAILPSIICLKLTFSDGLGGVATPPKKRPWYSVSLYQVPNPAAAVHPKSLMT